MDLGNIDNPIKTNNKNPGKFKHDLGSREIEEFIALKTKTYSLVTHGQSPFRNGTAKQNGIRKESNGKHEDYYNALKDNKERIVEECDFEKSGIRCQ